MVLISVVVPAINEAENLKILIPQIKKTLIPITKEYEIIVVDGHSTDATVQEAKKAGAIVVVQKEIGFGSALKEGFAQAKGEYIITIDADLSHEPEIIKAMWREKENADILIGSRYVRGGSAQQSLLRKMLSISLNRTLSGFLALPLKDLSSNFRMYKRTVLEEIGITSSGFEALLEILIQSVLRGFSIKEVPLQYHSRNCGVSKVRNISFGFAYWKTFFRFWKLRNSIQACDYDARGYSSLIPIQWYWHRRRYAIIMKNLPTVSGSSCKENNSILDIGCGSSMIIQDLPNAVALDVIFSKLRYLKKTNKKRITASVFSLPFQDKAFNTIIISEVIEHIPPKKEIFEELVRVLQPNGTLIIGTPDYATVSWNATEWIYDKFQNTYGHEHITHYTKEGLSKILKEYNFTVEGIDYICQGDMILKAKLHPQENEKEQNIQ